MDPVDALLSREFPSYDPYPNGAKREARLLVRHLLIAEALLSEYGKAFEGPAEMSRKVQFGPARSRCVHGPDPSPFGSL